ncbi:hypothetical protein VTL71DRAFT_13255 [Oculimacula yallundae]|uniref:Uncharacterized protein n=1 Tax=Oculimacula yallundae TaxID=86028 RepID=A0ABR4CKE5_9HELO
MMAPIPFTSTNATSCAILPVAGENHITAITGHSTIEDDSGRRELIRLVHSIIPVVVLFLFVMMSNYLITREKAKQCQMLHRIIGQPPGPAREEVILDLCVEMYDWYQDWRHDMGKGDELMESIPGAEKQWEMRHKG